MSYSQGYTKDNKKDTCIFIYELVSVWSIADMLKSTMFCVNELDVKNTNQFPRWIKA
jgi:hypothetical protein